MRNFLFVVCMVCGLAAAAAKSPAEVQQEFISSWTVTVEGEARARTLKIVGVQAKADGSFAIDATYGWSDGKLAPVTGQITGDQLDFTTPADTRITVTPSEGGKYKGNFNLKNGGTKAVVLSRVVEDMKVAGPKRPETNVPQACASFAGVWNGNWPNIGSVWLWVDEVALTGDKCMVKYSYGLSSKPPASFKQAEIKGGTLSFSRPDGGTTSFQMQSDVLQGRYSGPAGSNGAPMHRVQDVSAIAADQPVIPPTADLPVACAGFFGNWQGKWTDGGFGDLWLRVAEVKLVEGKCVARYSYSSFPVGKDWQTGEVKEGALTFLCNRSTGGTCVFQQSGAKLSASYTNSAGGRNAGTFQRTAK